MAVLLSLLQGDLCLGFATFVSIVPETSMAHVKGPSYNLLKRSDVNAPFKPHGVGTRRKPRASPPPPPYSKPQRIASPPTSQSIIRQTVRNQRVLPSQQTYKSKFRRDKEEGRFRGLLSSDDKDEETGNSGTTTTTVSSTRTEPAFVMPPSFDMSFVTEASLKSTPSVKTASFIDPGGIYSDDDDCFTEGTADTKETSFQEPDEFDLSFLRPKGEVVEERRCPFCYKVLPDSFTESPPTASRARVIFCQQHENAEILEMGKLKQYPSSFNTKRLRSRIQSLFPEIKAVIKSPTESEFLALQRTKTSRKNAAAPMIQMKLMEDSQPGYYGPQGAELISQIMMEKFGDTIRRKDKLFSALKFCGGVTGYVSTVLVPEVGVRLIMEDMCVDWEKAKEIMKESVEYGAVVNASVEVSDDDEDEDDSDMNSDLD